jgi:LysR family transcriptional regulator, hydrogen peroxide-inducible genes activator
MEIHEIRYFLGVCETLNFTRAAEHCNVTQPALTRAIKKLEDGLGAGPLIHRERGNIHLTELGRTMKPFFEASMSSLVAAKTTAKSRAKLGASTLSVGMMATVGPARLIDLFSRFARDNPRVEIRLQDGPVDMIEDHLTQGKIDIAIYCRPDPLPDRLHSIALFRERFMVALPPDDALSDGETVRMRDLNGRRYLGRAHCEYYEYLRDARLKLGGIEFERPYSSNRDDWVQSMVMAGLGFTYIPEYAVTMPSLILRPLVEPEVWRTVELVTVRGRAHAPPVGAFIHAARRHAWAGKVSLVGGAPRSGSELHQRA